MIDKYKRKIDYLRLSLTDKCNFRCFYCMPKEGIKYIPHNDLLTNENIVKLLKIFKNLGIKKIRFTGGEPLLKKNLEYIFKETYKLDFEKLCLTTNAYLLDKYLDSIEKYNINYINISLDTLKKDTFFKITNVDGFDRVYNNILNLLENKNINLKLNSVLINENFDELTDLVEFAMNKNVPIRFIEYMKFDIIKKNIALIPYKQAIDKISKRFNLKKVNNKNQEVAKYYTVNNTDYKIGFITPITDNFCSTCNKIRLTSDGKLKLCLLSNINLNLKDIIDKPDYELKNIIENFIYNKKPKMHNHTNISSKSMSQIGG